MNLGSTVNSSSRDAEPSISNDGSTLFFMSMRPGGLGNWDLWQVPIEPIVDLNSDGIVDNADICIIIDHWSTDEPLCDVGPMPWGDGVVDVQDLIVLAEHLQNAKVVHVVTVPGTACVFFAGQDRAILETDYPPDPVGSGGGHNFHNDTAPIANSMPPSIEVYGGGKLSISAAGIWGHRALSGPDGYDEPGWIPTHYEYVILGGIRRVTARRNTLIGVFLTDDPPDPGAMPPELASPTTTPLLQQAFSIGSSLENITVPEGATRLFFGLNDGSEWNNNVGSVEVTIEFLNSNPSVGPEPPDDSNTSEGFDLYLDDIGPNIIESSSFGEGILEYYSQDNPASGNYCIHWTGVNRYIAISFRFSPVKDLSVLVDEGFVVDFWVRCNSPNAKIDIRFVDTKTDDRGDHPWRMRYTIDRNLADWNGEWNHLQIPLSAFSEHGSWESGNWFGPIGAFDWTAIELFEIMAEYSDLVGVHFYFDDIRVVDVNPRR